MHFQVEKARRSSRISLISLPLLCSRFSFDPLSHLLASSPSLKKDNLSQFLNITPSLAFFIPLLIFFTPFHLGEDWDEEGCLLAC